jgi:hypothetical protein
MKPAERVPAVESGVQGADLIGENSRRNLLEIRRHDLALAGIAAAAHIRANRPVGVVRAAKAG